MLIAEVIILGITSGIVAVTTIFYLESRDKRKEEEQEENEEEQSEQKICKTCGCVIGDGKEMVVKIKGSIFIGGGHSNIFCQKCAPEYDIKYYGHDGFSFYREGTFECNEQGEVYGIAKPKKK